MPSPTKRKDPGIQIMQETAIAHFKDFFKSKGAHTTDTDYSFEEKTIGEQQGTKLSIIYQDKNKKTNRVLYHIKTPKVKNPNDYSNKCAAPVDLKELAVSKILQKIDWGSDEIHFIHNPVKPKHFYLASKDLGTNKTPSIGVFVPFFEIQKNFKTVNNASLSRDDVVTAFISLDIISRILGLTDTLGNPDNFGYIIFSDKTSQWKLLDFITPSLPRAYNNINIFRGFKKFSGRHNYNYDYIDFLIHIFQNKDTAEQKITSGLTFVKKVASRLHKAIDESLLEVTQYANKNHAILNIDLKSSLDDLYQYCQGSQNNLRRLKNKLESKRQNTTKPSLFIPNEPKSHTTRNTEKPIRKKQKR